MTDTRDVYRVDVCADCLMVIANGDETGIPDDELEAWSAGFNAYLAANPTTVIVPECDDACCHDGFFSRYRCEVCRRPTGGMRHPCAAWEHVS